MNSQSKESNFHENNLKTSSQLFHFNYWTWINTIIKIYGMIPKLEELFSNKTIIDWICIVLGKNDDDMFEPYDGDRKINNKTS